MVMVMVMVMMMMMMTMNKELQGKGFALPPRLEEMQGSALCYILL